MLVLFCLPIASLMGCARVPLTTADIDYFQPPIVATVAPERPITNYSLHNNTIKVNLAPMRPIIPAYNNKGNLLASWTPHPQGIANRPTVVIVHGGHGLIPGDFATAVWARDQLGANTLAVYIARALASIPSVIAKAGAMIQRLAPTGDPWSFLLRAKILRRHPAVAQRVCLAMQPPGRTTQRPRTAGMPQTEVRTRPL